MGITLCYWSPPSPLEAWCEPPPSALLQVGGRVLIPGTAMFEACAAAASVLLEGPHMGSAALQGVTIADPLLMPVQASLVLEAAVSLRDGSVQLCSIAPGRSARRAATKLHCSGVYAAVQQPAAGSDVAEHQAGTASGTIRRLFAAAAVNADNMQQSAVAGIWVPPSAQQNGYCMQPARSDAVLHLSGAFNHQAAPLQIPVAMSALVIQSAGSHSCWVHPTATPAPAGSGSSNGGQVSLSYRLHGQQAQPLFELAGLLVKEVGAAASAAAPAVAAAVQPAAAEAPAEFMYSIDWQVEQQQAQAAAGSLQAAAALTQRKGAWSVAGDSSVVMQYSAYATSSTSGVVAAAADGLELLQRRLPQMSAGSLSLQVATAPSILPSSGASCAAAPAAAAPAAAAAASLGALIKVAGMEFAAVSMRSSRADAATPAAAQAAAAEAMDAFGTASSGGALLRAKLLRQPLAVMPPNSHLMPLPRGSLAGIRLAPHTQAAPGPGEIKVGCRCTTNGAHSGLPACTDPTHPTSLLMLPAGSPAGVCARRGAQLPGCAQRAGHVPRRPRPSRRRLRRRGGGGRRGGARPGAW